MSDVCIYNGYPFCGPTSLDCKEKGKEIGEDLLYDASCYYKTYNTKSFNSSCCNSSCITGYYAGCVKKKYDVKFTSCWMTKMIGKIKGKKINSIPIPGTHDSATYDLPTPDNYLKSVDDLKNIKMHPAMVRKDEKGI